MTSLAAPASSVIARESRRIRTGFIPLIDAAILIAAEEMGFARAEGVTLELKREVSWSNIRDRLAFRQFDAAHLLGAMAVASQVGIGTNPFPVLAPMALGRGGNAITVSNAIAEAMDAAMPLERPGLPPALAHAKALASVVAARRASNGPPLVFGVVYPFSSHNYEFRFWLACGGLDPDRDVRMTVVPPPLTADALDAGAIDGFCVNAPWNVLAVQRGIGRIVAVKADIWPSSPEKVLGLRPGFAEENGDTVARLLVALDRAARWCDDPAHRQDLATLIADARYLDADRGVLAETLAGDLPIGRGERRTLPNYLTFHRDGATIPRRGQALWTFSQMVRWGQVEDGTARREAAAGAFRPDILAAALGTAPAPERPAEGTDPNDRFLDGRPFDPADIAGYVAGFAIRAAARDTRQHETD